MGSGAGPLSHLRVIDLTHYIAGPYCTKLMAGFGAEVIKIEKPPAGDPLRRLGPFAGEDENPECGIPFLWLNTGKKSVTLDLKSDAGKSTFFCLVKDADVVVENFKPSVMSGLGLGYDVIRKVNPGLVMTSISNFGQTGPYRDYEADEIQLYAMSGLMYETGEPDQPPLCAGPALTQYSAGASAYIATLMALLQREVTGRGQHVDVSIQEAAMNNIEVSLVECLQLGKVRKRNGHRHVMVPWETYACADGEVALIGGPIRHWKRGARIFEDPELVSRYPHILDRMRNREAFEGRLRPLVKKWRKKDLFLAGQEHKLAFGYLAGMDEAFDSPQHRHRGFFEQVHHPVAGNADYCGPPFVMAKSPWNSGRAPLLGEHNPAVFPERLGLSGNETGQWTQIMGHETGSLPLEGIRVIDFTRDWTGPLSTRLLGDFGAEVIKVEYVKRMCSFRGGYIENQQYNRHPRWHQVNRNKRSVTLDLDLDFDREAFKDLVRISDVVVQNCRPGVMEKFGLSYPELLALRPDIILVSLTAFGLSGPFASFSGYGATIEALSGVTPLTAYAPQGRRYRIKEMDVSNGMMAAGAVMTALVHRQRTGEGQFLDVSLLETATHMTAGEHFLEYSLKGAPALPLGNRSRRYAPRGCYRCKGEDKWVTITIRTDGQWRRFCVIIGHPEWAIDSRFINRNVRSGCLEEIDQGIEAWTRNLTHIEAMQFLQAEGIPAGAVLNAAELCGDAHLEHRHYFMEAMDGSQGRYPGMIARLSAASPVGILRRGPDLGQDNEFVLCALLGKAREDLRPLEQMKIGTAYDPD